MAVNNVHQLDNQYTRMKQSRHKEILKSRKKRGIILVSTFLLIFAVLTFQIISTKQKVRNISEQQVQSQQELKKSKVDNKKLKENIKQLHDNDYIQKIIRERYYYTKPGETVYSLPGDVSKDVTQN
ncbi:MAG: septum formation initiator family protein [Apilactobacillus sp.]|uniref:FtsB family cell division protein n=1 Tax=Apilactobacillus TaxID=2767877 RepID=UPI0025DCF7D2|nr:septum formation initiator family protein [Apilactobacillus sp.]MCT6822850.1 septum formation initiator family protein [Apilactobacillus sp.]MCT6858533.1 septum formation initiator family protein [Apilactobacillus sp.]